MEARRANRLGHGHLARGTEVQGGGRRSARVHGEACREAATCKDVLVELLRAAGMQRGGRGRTLNLLRRELWMIGVGEARRGSRTASAGKQVPLCRGGRGPCRGRPDGSGRLHCGHDGHRWRGGRGGCRRRALRRSRRRDPIIQRRVQERRSCASHPTPPSAGETAAAAAAEAAVAVEAAAAATPRAPSRAESADARPHGRSSRASAARRAAATPESPARAREPRARPRVAARGGRAAGTPALAARAPPSREAHAGESGAPGRAAGSPPPAHPPAPAGRWACAVHAQCMRKCIRGACVMCTSSA